jgi:hypothetical protein
VENESYLVADMSLNCGSDEWRDGAIYAAFMVLVYPVGIPMMYLSMLYQVKNDIIAMRKSLRDGNKNDNDDGSDGKVNVSSLRPTVSGTRSYSDNGVASDPSDTSPENEPNSNTSSREHRSISDQHITMNFTIDMNDDIINQYSQQIEVKSIRFLWEPYKETYW